jgi:autotransporter-associated beta strand protein
MNSIFDSFPRSFSRGLATLFALGLIISTQPLSQASDVTWTNGGNTSQWNLTDPNWSTGLWNNLNGDGAVFGATGVGAINVTAPVNVDSIGFTADGYTLNGPGPINFVKGSSSLGTGGVFADTSQTETINAPISSSLGISKTGAGVLQLGGAMTFSGIGLPATSGINLLPVDIYAAGLSGGPAGGTIRIMNTGVLPTTTRLGLSNGLVDLGANNITVASVTFTNDMDNTPFNPATGSAGVGIIGTGTLNVTGDINVLASPGGFNAGSNSIGANLDFGGGTQVIRVAGSGSFSLQSALQLTGVLSNGSLLKTYSYNPNGMMVSADGTGFFGNNTYTGSTVINGGQNVVTGTNASTFVEVVGPPGAGNTSTLSLQGANGSYLSATTILAASGGTLTLDNNASLTNPTGPTVPAAQNSNRLADNVEIQLREGNFTYRGLTNTAATETIGRINILSGHNIITLATSGTGTAAVTDAGDFTMVPRSTVAISSTTLGGTAQLFVNGAVPPPDATGILPRVVSSTDFLTYNGTTGFTPFTGYATDFNTPGTNVSVTAATAVNSSVNINALKRGTSSFAITLGSGVTLGINSGMILSTGGTGTYTGGTIDFGSTPGAFFGSNTVSSAITGSAGLLNAAGTLTLNGNLSGLTGTITQNSNSGTTTLATNTFGDALELRVGFMNINTSLPNPGTITIGNPANESNIVAAEPSLSISGAGANSTIARDIIVNNGGQNSAGVRYGNSLMPGLSPLSNTTGSQTLSGNITLNSPLRLQGGGAGGTGSTNFTGNIQGSSYLRIVNGRAAFSGNLSNAGGFFIGEQGNTTRITFNGTTTGVAPLVLNGATTNQVSYASGALPTGTISTNNVDSLSVPLLIPLDSSTINNPFSLTGNTFINGVLGGGSVGANVGSGISATWTGQMSGLGGVVKSGVGTLTLTGANTYTGTTSVNAGTLLVNGSSASPNTTVASGASLGVSNAALSGGGTITLNGGEMHDNPPNTSLLNTDFVHGFGQMNFSLNFTNSSGGVIQADNSGQTLQLNTTGALTNNGLFAARNGATLLRSGGTFTNFSGSTLTGGAYLAADSTLNLNTDPIIFNDATVVLSGPNSVFTPINSIGENDGTFVITNGRTFAATPSGPHSPAGTAFPNTDTLIIGPNNSTVAVTGDYAQGSNSVLEIVIGANYPDPSFHHMTVTGSANLAGTLSVKLANGFVPAPGQMFEIVHAGTINGGFTTVTGATVTYTSTGVFINATGNTNALQLTSAVSRKTHGSAGTFDINLPLTGPAGVECRSSGGNHTLVFTFSNNLLTGNASLTTGTGTVSGSPTFAGKTMTVNLTGVADAQQVTVTLSGLTDVFSQTLPSQTINMEVLLGDTTGNGTVDASDIAQTKSQAGVAVTGANFREDVTVDGMISASDIALVKSHAGAGGP